MSRKSRTFHLKTTGNLFLRKWLSLTETMNDGNLIYNRDNNACYNREKRLFLILVVSENKICIFLNIFSQKALRFGDTRTMCDFEQVNSSLKDL